MYEEYSEEMFKIMKSKMYMFQKFIPTEKIAISQLNYSCNFVISQMITN